MRSDLRTPPVPEWKLKCLSIESWILKEETHEYSVFLCLPRDDVAFIYSTHEPQKKRSLDLMESARLFRPADSHKAEDGMWGQ